MYNLYRINNDLYQFHSTFDSGEAKEGTLLAILTYAVHRYGFKVSVLEEALLDMLEFGEDSAKFDGYRKYMYSYNRFVKKAG